LGGSVWVRREGKSAREGHPWSEGTDKAMPTRPLNKSIEKSGNSSCTGVTNV